MLEKIESIKSLIGKVPAKRLNFSKVDMYAKLEYLNYSGSVKDRAAIYILEQAILNGEIDHNTTVIESSSGNFAIALASICRELGIKFIPVVDPNINKMNLEILNILSYRVEMVHERDCTGGYLLTRIEKVKELCQQVPNSYWPNQYENPNNPKAYSIGLATEIAREFPDLDYVFISVSSAGTIMGVSKILKATIPGIHIIAVDIEGSVIFGYPPSKRYVSGLGAGKVPLFLDMEYLDEVIIVSHDDIVEGCFRLFREHLVFGGASSGAVYAALEKKLNKQEISTGKGLLLCPDRGFSYMDTVFNPDWRPAAKENSRAPQSLATF